MIKIICPKCKHCLGDTKTSFDAVLNCRWCKEKINVKVIIANTTDYFKVKEKK